MRRDLLGLWLPEALASIYHALHALAFKEPHPQISQILRDWGVEPEDSDPQRDQDTIARNLLLFHAQAQSVKNAKK